MVVFRRHIANAYALRSQLVNSALFAHLVLRVGIPDLCRQIVPIDKIASRLRMIHIVRLISGLPVVNNVLPVGDMVVTDHLRQ